jgi:trk system potassium uptake protein TrkA
MAQQILIIGLGQFGMSLARALSEKAVEVLAVDTKASLVEEASAFVTEAIRMDVTDEVQLSKIQPQKRDVAVCAIGDESRESSILCTALLKQLGVKHIISRASDQLHRRILQAVGANQIINPEEEFGRRYANRLLYRDHIADTHLGEDLQLTEILVQPWMVGKNLIELSLPKQFSVMVVGVRKVGSHKILRPSPESPLSADDTIVIASSESAIQKLIKKS